MNLKELTKTFVMLSNWKNPVVSIFDIKTSYVVSQSVNHVYSRFQPFYFPIKKTELDGEIGINSPRLA